MNRAVLSLFCILSAFGCFQAPEPWTPLAKDGTVEDRGTGEDAVLPQPDSKDIQDTVPQELPPDVAPVADADTWDAPFVPDFAELSDLPLDLPDQIPETTDGETSDAGDAVPDLDATLDIAEEVDGVDIAETDGVDIAETDGVDISEADIFDAADEISFDIAPDEIASCQDVCDISTATCGDDGVPLLCQEGEEGCTVWVAGEACPQSHLCICDDEQSGVCSAETAPCKCMPSCVGKECGDDGCGGVCAECPDGYSCEETDGATTCKPVCEELCAELECGDAGTNVCDCGTCADAAVCKTTTCEAPGLCVIGNAPDGDDCDDGEVCTTSDQCESGACQGTPLEECCAVDAQCDDENQCTVDSCEPLTHTCIHDKGAANGLPCYGDTDGCTDEVCFLGQCVFSNTPECEPSGPCVDSQCVSVSIFSHDCEETPVEAGQPCDDNLFCTEGDLCDGGGTCAPGPQRDCSAAADQCELPGCNEDLDQCEVAGPAALDTPCDADNDGCTEGDVCVSGVCDPGALVVCPSPAAECYVASCSSTGPESYECLESEALAGTACNDGLFCTEPDECDGAGVCTGPMNTCGIPANQCSQVACLEDELDCAENPLPDGTPCDDGEACTLADACSGGFCEGNQDACGERRVNTETKLSGQAPVAGPQQTAHLSFGTSVAVWRAGDWLVRARLVDDEHSLSYPEKELVVDWPLSSDSCGVGDKAMTTQAVAANSAGKFVVAAAYRYAQVYQQPGNGSICQRRYNYQLLLAGYDGKGEVVSPAVELGPPSIIWNGYAKKLGTLNAGECSCNHYPDDYSGWMGAGFPDHQNLPGDSLSAVSFPGGTFGVLRQAMHKPEHNQPATAAVYYHAVSAGFEANQEGIELGQWFRPRACTASDNQMLIVYDDDAGNIEGRFMQFPGNALSDSLPVTSMGGGNLASPFCSALTDGRFVVSFTDCVGGGPCDVHFEVLSANGALENIHVVPHFSKADIQASTSPPLALPGGAFALAWHDESGDNDGYAAYAAVFDSNGQSTSPNFLLHEGQGENQTWPSLHLVEGDLFAAWTHGAGDQRDISFRRFDLDGEPTTVAPERLASGPLAGLHTGAKGAAYDDGSFALVWEGENLVGGSGKDVALGFFAEDGSATAVPIAANANALEDQTGPDIAINASNDGAVVVWEHPNANGQRRIVYRVFDDVWNPLGPEEPVNEIPEHEQFEPVVEYLPDGRFVVAYVSDYPVGDHEDAFGQRFLADGTKDGSGYSINKLKTHREWEVAMTVKGGAQPTVFYAFSKAQFPDGPYLGVYARPHPVDGTAGPVVQVETEGEPQQPALAYHDSTGLIMCWKAGSVVECHKLDDTANLSGSKYVLPSVGDPQNLSIAYRDATTLWVVYDDHSPGDGDGRAVVRRELNLVTGTESPPTLLNWTTVGNQTHPLVVPTAETAIIGFESHSVDETKSEIRVRILD